MKTLFHILICIIASAVIILIGHSCYLNSDQQCKTNIEPESVEFMPLDSIFKIGDKVIEIRLMCEENLWLNTNGIDLDIPLMQDLVDMYNAATAIRSIFTDFDLAMRFKDYIPEAKTSIMALDLSIIANQETKEAIKQYQEQMLALFDLKPDSVNQEEVNPYLYRDQADAFISEKYNITHYCETEIRLLSEQLNNQFWNNTDVPDWNDLQERRGDATLEPELLHRYSQSKTLDEKCIYLIELSHVHVAAKYAEKSNYPGLIYQFLISSEYSKYLLHVWTHWRCICQYELGASKDSYIPNWIFNQVRNRCAYSTLSYIAQHPTDKMAINMFMQISSEQNIYREGTYSYGNQNAIDFYCLFHEEFEDEKDVK